jgi:UDP:flavonoid glycosyltransferase YjiC (YdhE family)
MPSVDRAKVVRAVSELSRATGTRVLLFSAYDEDAAHGLPEAVLPVRELNHRRLFPRLDWIVHHGGAGTTAAALRAGVPQLIVPHIVDQFFHGRRIAELGLGPDPIPKARLDTTSLLAAFERSRGCVERARTLGQELSRSNGADAAATYLEELRSTRVREQSAAGLAFRGHDLHDGAERFAGGSAHARLRARIRG